MDTTITITKNAKSEIYEEVIPQLRGLVEGEDDLTANLANVSSALKIAFPERFSWVGFYIKKGGDLVLGPFQGKPACVRISPGKGVCGSAASRKEAVIVADVHMFPGHIACDPDSRSEIVIPIMRGNRVMGVLDVDSREVGSFDNVDEDYLKRICDIVAGLAWPA